MKTKYINHILIVFIFGFFTTYCFSQDIDNYRMLYKFKTIKQADNSRVLEVSFIARNKKDRKDKVPVYDANIKYYNVLNDDNVLLGEAKTDKEGTSKLVLSSDQNYLIDEEGYINFKAVFEGSDSLDEEEDEIAVKDLFLELNLEEIDSINTVIVNAFVLDSLKSKVPVEELDVIVSVGGMISRLPIEENTIEDGELEFEFPDNIPGDKNGLVTVYAFIEDSDDYGSVLAKNSKNWGSILNNESSISKEKEKLWSDYAPMWMYIVLTILLVGVWANYVYTIANLFKIKKEGQKLSN